MAREITVKASWKGIIPDCLLMPVVIGLFTIFKKIPEILSTKIVISRSRVSGFTGIANRQSMDEPMKHISSVQVEQDPLAQLCNYGTLIICTQSGRIKFRYIPDPKRVKALIMQLVEKS